MWFLLLLLPPNNVLPWPLITNIFFILALKFSHLLYTSSEQNEQASYIQLDCSMAAIHFSPTWLLSILLCPMASWPSWSHFHKAGVNITITQCHEAQWDQTTSWHEMGFGPIKFRLLMSMECFDKIDALAKQRLVVLMS